MSYISENLIPNEKIILTGKMHWFIYAHGLLLFLLGLLFSDAPPETATWYIKWLLGISGVYHLVRARVMQSTTELAITSKRILAKYGFIRRSSIEIVHSKVESITVHQGFFGRIFDFGTVAIYGSGGAGSVLKFIRQPLGFRKEAANVIDLDKTQGVTPHISNAAPQGDYIEMLTRLAELKKNGVLTDEEFETQKKALLAGKA
jgi:uncharacterized membrane protein YdbT with pleckstrin-like domain